MESSTAIEHSINPGIREYYIRRPRYSLRGRPIGCFAIVGCCLLLVGVGMVVWESKSRPRLELNNFYQIMRTLGTTFLSLGLFVFLASTLLICETAISERSRRNTLQETRSVQEDLLSTQDYGSKWDSSFDRAQRDEFDFVSKRTRSFIISERPTSRLVRCVSDSHFDQTRPTRSRRARYNSEMHWGSDDHRSGSDRTDSRALTKSLSPTGDPQAGSSNYRVESHQRSTVMYAYEGPAQIHRKERYHKKRKKRRGEVYEERWNYSGDHLQDRRHPEKPRLRVSLSEEAFENHSSVDSGESDNHGCSDFSVNRNNSELLSLLVERGILKFEDFRHYFTLCKTTGMPDRPTQSLPSDSPRSVGTMSPNEETKTAEVEHHHHVSFSERFRFSDRKTVPETSHPKILHRKLDSITKEIPHFRKVDLEQETAGCDTKAPARVLFTIGELTRSSSSEDKLDAISPDERTTGSSINDSSQKLSQSLPETYQQNFETFHSRSLQSHLIGISNEAFESTS